MTSKVVKRSTREECLAKLAKMRGDLEPGEERAAWEGRSQVLYVYRTRQGKFIQVIADDLDVARFYRDRMLTWDGEQPAEQKRDH